MEARCQTVANSCCGNASCYPECTCIREPFLVFAHELLACGEESHHSTLTSYALISRRNTIETTVYPESSAKLLLLRPGSMKAAVFSMTSATLGAGIVSLPHAFKSLGFFGGLLTITTLSLLTHMSTIMLLRRQIKDGSKSYEQLSYSTGGLVLLRYTQASQILLNFGAAVGYIVCLRDVLTTTLPQVRQLLPVTPASANLWIAFVTAAVLCPLCSVRRITTLRWASMISLVSLEILVAMTIILLIFREPSNTLGQFPYVEHLLPPSATAAIQGISIVTFSLSSQSNAPMILSEIERPGLNRINRVVTRSVSFAAATYLAIGYAGYLLFGVYTNGNLLLNYKNEIAGNQWILAGFCSIFAGVILSFPMCIIPCRVTFGWADTDQSNFSRKNTATSSLLVFSALLCALMIPSIATVFAFTGSVAGASVAFILPSTLTLLAATSRVERLQAAVVITFGVAISIAGTYSYIADWAKPSLGWINS